MIHLLQKKKKKSHKDYSHQQNAENGSHQHQVLPKQHCIQLICSGSSMGLGPPPAPSRRLQSPRHSHCHIGLSICPGRQWRAPMPIFVNKVLLESCQAHSFSRCIVEELQQRPPGPQSRKHLLWGPFQKWFSTSALQFYNLLNLHL